MNKSKTYKDGTICLPDGDVFRIHKGRLQRRGFTYDGNPGFCPDPVWNDYFQTFDGEELSLKHQRENSRRVFAWFLNEMGYEIVKPDRRRR